MEELDLAGAHVFREVYPAKVNIIFHDVTFKGNAQTGRSQEQLRDIWISVM